MKDFHDNEGLLKDLPNEGLLKDPLATLKEEINARAAGGNFDLITLFYHFFALILIFCMLLTSQKKSSLTFPEIKSSLTFPELQISLTFS